MDATKKVFPSGKKEAKEKKPAGRTIDQSLVLLTRRTKDTRVSNGNTLREAVKRARLQGTGNQTKTETSMHREESARISGKGQQNFHLYHMMKRQTTE